MIKRLLMIFCVLILMSGCAFSDSSDAANNEHKPTGELSPTLTVTAKPTAEATPSPTVTAEPTAEATPSPTVTAKPTAQATPSPAVTAKPTAQVTPSPTLEPVYTYTEKNIKMYTTASVNVRDLPKQEGNKLGTLPREQEVVVTGVCNETGWYRISYNETVGYMSNLYLTEEKPVEPTREPSKNPGTVVYANGMTNTLPSVGANGKKIAVDAGHQRKGMSELEPNAPGSSEMKKKLTSGTQGVSTGIAEYVLNLQVSLYLKEELLSRGYEVFMIRENHDCPVSNAERAVAANNSGADIFVRIHANSVDNSSVRGGLTMAPSKNNRYVGHLAGDSQRLAALLADYMNGASGFKNKGVQTTDTMTGINWCKIPVSIVEMGFMSNPEEDVELSKESVRRKIAKGIADGIDAYFGF